MKLFKHTETEYELVKHHFRVVGTKEFIIAHMLLQGVMEQEIEMGFSYLESPEIKVAHYGFGYSGQGPMFIFADKLAS